jgi:hypothetical protein
MAQFKPFPLFLLMMLASGAAVSAQSVTNGSFNTPASSPVTWGSVAGGPGAGTVNWTQGAQYAYDPTNILGWSFNGGAGIQQNGSAWGFSNDPLGASQTAFLQNYDGSIPVPTGNPATVNPSTVTGSATGLTAGVNYYLTFYMEQRNSSYGTNPVTVVIGINGQTYEATTPASTGWTPYSVEFTATGDPEQLMFEAFAPQTTSFYDNDTGLAEVAVASASPVGAIPIARVPEGGAAWLYLLLALAGCFVPMFFAFRNSREDYASA